MTMLALLYYEFERVNLQLIALTLRVIVTSIHAGSPEFIGSMEEAPIRVTDIVRNLT